MDWKVLGIEETKDKNAIKNAYREALTFVNPEDEPEKFKKLRKAYEDALAYADSEDTEDTDNTPIGIWLKKVDNVYSAFSKRIDEKQWLSLMNDDVCQQLDTRIEARDRLLKYIMNHYYFPKCVWLVLENTFSLLENKDALYEEFPKDFVDYCVISGIENNPVIKYELFEEDDSLDYETFISMFFNIRRKVRNRDYEGLDALFGEIDELEIHHPYLEAERVSYFLSQSKFNEAKSLIDEVYERFHDEIPILYMRAEVSYSMNSYQEARDSYNELLEIEPQHYYAKVGLADCLMYQEDYSGAKEIYVESIKVNRYDNYVRGKLDEVNEKLFSYYENKIKENPDDSVSRFELGWCYLQNQRYKDTIDILEGIAVPEDKKTEYYNLMSRAYHDNSENDRSWEMLIKWKEAVESENPDDNVDKIKILFLQGCIKEEDQNYKEAEVFFDEIIKLDENYADAYMRKAIVLCNMKRYEETIEICNKLNLLDSYNFTGYYQKAVALFELGYYYDAMGQFEESINTYPYYLDSYIYKIRIYLIYNEYDRANEVVAYLDEQGIKSSKLEFYRARILDCLDKIDEAMNIYQEIALKAEKETTDLDRIEHVYYYMAIIELEVRKDAKKAYEYIEKALSINPDDIGSNVFYGDLLKREKKYEESLIQFEKVLSLNPKHAYIYNEIGLVYEKMDDYEKALKYHTKQLDNDDRLYYRVHRGLIFMSLDRLDEAREDFYIAIELDPLNPHAYNNIGICYQCEDKLDEALKYYEKTMEILENEPFDKIYRNMATTYTRLHKFDKAVECYEKCLEKFNVASDYWEIASIYKKAGEYEKAREALEKWNSKGENTALSDCLQEIAACYYEEYNDKEYLETLKAAYHANSSNEDVLYSMGSYYYKNKKYLKARSFYEKIIHLYPNSKYAYYNIVNVYKKIKLNGQAKKYTEMGLKIISEMSETTVSLRKKKYWYLGDLYFASGDLDNAKKYYNKCAEIRKCNNCRHKKCTDLLYSLGVMYEKLNEIEKANGYYRECLEENPYDRDYNEAVERTTLK